MRDYVSDIAFTDKVKEIQKQHGSRDNYARMEQGRGWQNTVTKYLIFRCLINYRVRSKL